MNAARCVAELHERINGLHMLAGVQVPQSLPGAMYVFFRVANVNDTLALFKTLVTKAGLSLVPGIAFDKVGEGYLR